MNDQKNNMHGKDEKNPTTATTKDGNNSDKKEMPTKPVDTENDKSVPPSYM